MGMRSRLFLISLTSSAVLALSLLAERGATRFTRGPHITPELVDEGALAAAGLLYRRGPQPELTSRAYALFSRATPRTNRDSRRVPLLHDASVEVVERLALFVRFGAMSVPWVNDTTGRLSGDASLDEALQMLRAAPSRIALIRWTGASRWDAALAETVWKEVGYHPHTEVDESLRELRREIREVRVVWLAEAPLTGVSGRAWRQATRDLRNLRRLLRRLEQKDPSLASLIGPSGVRAVPDDERRHQFQILERLLIRAENLIHLQRHTSARARLLRTVEYLSGVWLAPGDRPAYEAALSRARDAGATNAELDASTAFSDTSALTFSIPGPDQELFTAGVIYDVFPISPREGGPLQAPWLHGLDVISPDGLPPDFERPRALRLQNTSTKQVWIQALRPGPEHSVTTRFEDLAPGEYTLQSLWFVQHQPPSPTSQPRHSVNLANQLPQWIRRLFDQHITGRSPRASRQVLRSA